MNFRGRGGGGSRAQKQTKSTNYLGEIEIVFIQNDQWMRVARS